MSDQLRLPPSERDFEVFFAVAIQSVSTRRAAELHHISQTRVRQIVTLVGDWVADNLPDWGEADLNKQVRLAQQIAANRLEHQYEQAMRFWDAERDPKYLRQATRIALAQSRLGITAGRIHALAANVTAGPAALGDDLPVGCISAAQCTTTPGTSAAQHTSSPTDHCPLAPNPSVEDCSPSPFQSSAADTVPDDDPDLTDSPETLIEQERQRRLNEFDGSAIMERRLLTLIEAAGNTNPERVAQLNETLSRVRASKATAELRLSRFIRGIHLEPLNLQPHSTRTDQLQSAD